MLDRLAGNQYYCFLDGFSDYFQIPIDPKDQEKTTFTCPYGMFAYCRMPFGLCNAPGTFQMYIMAIFHDMIEKTMEVFMDDFSVFKNYFQSCLSHLGKMLKRCEETNLYLNWEKSHFMVKEGIVLGHKIFKEGIEVEKAKVEVITKLPHPTTVKEQMPGFNSIVRAFASLGHDLELGYNENYNSYPYDSSSLLQQFLCCTCCEGPHETCQCSQLIFDEPYCKHCRGPHMNYQCQPMNQDSYNSNSLSFDQPQPSQSPVIQQPPQELSIQEMEDLKQQYLDELKRLNQFEDFSESNQKFSSTDDDSFSFDEIDYVKASPPDSELVSSEVLFDAKYESDSSDDQSCSDEDVLEKIISKPLCEEEIIPMKSMGTHDSSLPISSKIDSLLEEFADYPMPSGIEDKDYDSERDILIPKDFPRNNTLSFAEKEPFHFDISPFSRPPAKPPD
nr:reverse transcriptase domain-containing protein [Tanacetum cinerariifolium]